MVVFLFSLHCRRAGCPAFLTDTESFFLRQTACTADSAPPPAGQTIASCAKRLRPAIGRSLTHSFHHLLQRTYPYGFPPRRGIPLPRALLTEMMRFPVTGECRAGLLIRNPLPPRPADRILRESESLAFVLPARKRSSLSLYLRRSRTLTGSLGLSRNSYSLRHGICFL